MSQNEDIAHTNSEITVWLYTWKQNSNKPSHYVYSLYSSYYNCFFFFLDLVYDLLWGHSRLIVWWGPDTT